MEAQDDISFGFEVLHLDGDRAFVTGGPPTCELGTGSGSGSTALDLQFDPATGLCRSLREWWHADRTF